MAYGWCQLRFLNPLGLWVLVSNLIASTMVQLSLLISGCLCWYELRYGLSYLVFWVICQHPLLIHMTFSLKSIPKSLFSMAFPKMRPILLSLSLLYSHYPLGWTQDLSISDFLCAKLDCAGCWETALRPRDPGCSLSHCYSTASLAWSLWCYIYHRFLWEAFGVFPASTSGNQQHPSDLEFS